MIDEVSDVFGWERKHTIKALNGKVSLGAKAKKRGSKPKFGTAETEVIIAIWKLSEQPCSLRPKETLPDWLPSYEKHYGPLVEDIQKGGGKAFAIGANLSVPSELGTLVSRAGKLAGTPLTALINNASTFDLSLIHI